jgi:transcriptional regulator with XRE-family HTH domain
MSIDYAQIGGRLRAYRLGAGLTPESMAKRLGVSRTALYNYEKGEVIKLETLERAADLLGVSVASLLGAPIEYFGTAAAFFERVRQIEADAEHIVAYFEPISFLLASPNYTTRLRAMVKDDADLKPADRSAAERAIAKLAERRTGRHGPKSITSIISVFQIRRMLQNGLVGSDRIAAATRRERQLWAREEVERIVKLMENPPISVQIGIVEGIPASQTFQLFRRPDATYAAVSPFRLGDMPNLTLGIAMITAAPEAVALYEHVAEQLWNSALKDRRGAKRLRALLNEVKKR